ncbi:family 16 glycosylhydrolase [Belnapia sp. T6]|uniref:Family 16 glycosylhydrolase n=1 Tax=Belnapia mucosa TaxID=2804532 RepID=A0ABS1V8U0_9PROT|nr:carbohydrate-binding domain-containing protein [Belnapia mucosa]MBL6458083.1 family 16 glycosylhydrolase [Belnapia mucosa]
MAASTTSTSTKIDWNAIGALVNAYHDATGKWVDYDSIVAMNWTPGTTTVTPMPVPTPAPAPMPTPAPAAVNWNAIGALVTAYHDATGKWATYEDINAMGWKPGGTTTPAPSNPTPSNPTPSNPAPTTPAPVNTTLGTGKDTFVIKISEDAYKGDAQYTIKVDGQQIGGTLTAHASHALGQDDIITLHGNWGAGAHTVTVTFLNDLYGGTSATDRNLHVDAVSYNGKAQAGGDFDLNSNGSHDFAIAATQVVTTPTTPTTPTNPSTPVTPPSTSGESILPSGYDLVWRETFDGGLGKFSHNYGHVWAHDGQVDIASWAGDGFGQSGAMIAPSGPSAGFGYGLFSWTVKGNQDSAPGAFMCLWPASDQWPGPELDMAEVAPDGSVYSTIHWKGADGSDQFQSYKLDGIKFTDKHTYAMDWQDGRLTGYVDGVQKWTTTEHVPKDFAHGGENSVPGVGEQAAWAAAYQNGDNLVTLYEATYSTHSVIG